MRTYLVKRMPGSFLLKLVFVLFLFVRFEGSVYSEEVALTPTPTAAPNKMDQSVSQLAGDDFGKLPTYISSDSLSVQTETRTFTYTGNVQVRQGDMTLTCDFLEGKYTDKNKIEQLVARSNVILVKGDTIRATGQRAVYDGTTEIITMTESPELQQNDSILTADTVRILLKENRSMAEGAVRVKLVKKDGVADSTQLIPGKQ